MWTFIPDTAWNATTPHVTKYFALFCVCDKINMYLLHLMLALTVLVATIDALGHFETG